MPARLTIHTPDEPVRLRTVTGTCTFGRAPECDIQLDHASVSRTHARLEHSGLGWLLYDLGSKNGVRVEGRRVTSWMLRPGEWFVLGDVYLRFEEVTDEILAASAGRGEQRRLSSSAWRGKLDRADGEERLLADLIHAFVDLAECRRGFLLVGDARAEMRVRACFALDPGELSDIRFVGSHTAVARAMRLRRPVFLADPEDQAWLKGKASVVGQGIRALVCYPLESDGRLIGAAYADSDESARLFTELDAEILSGFAQHAAMTLATGALAERLAQLDACFAVGRGGEVSRIGEAPSWSAPSTHGVN
jgi:hypothetical protein